MVTQPGPRGTPIGWILAGSAVTGIALGLGLAARKASQDEEAELHVAPEVAQVVPIGHPMAATADMMRPDPRALSGIPPYPHGVARALTSGATTGARVNSAWFSTPDSPDAVISFYEKAFARENRQFAAHRYSARTGFIGWLERPDTEDGGLPDFDKALLHLVTVVRQGEETVVLLSSSEPAKLLEGDALPGGVFLPSGAHPHAINVGEGGVTKWVIMASYPDGQMKNLDDQLVEWWKAHGWSLDERTPAATRTGLVASRKGLTQIVRIEAQPGGTRVTLWFDQKDQGAQP